ncbi:SRSF protein kinase 2-like isoform X2 [Dunckerocampus dactyliophorus]|uniref:SRSF protein kinase 2-like isoform X2 n=1 Tax=Dunckerocampus dactyliophorus TaxID=161453 RepID=UPI002406E7DB|nr:SRSF protein kinase 2-like isoform X2 [Dunckerocampus dactyliophorus]
MEMSSSYAAAISALVKASSPHSAPDQPGSPKCVPSPSPVLQHCPPVQAHPSPPVAVGSYEEQENPAEYGIASCVAGGYYPVEVGEIFEDRYQVVRKLGWGHFSTVWLCWDMVKGRFVALKVVKSAATYSETALDEIKLLKCVRDSDPRDPKRESIVHLIDDFRISGVNGEHVCMVLEVLGHHVLKWIIKSNYNGLPLPCVKIIIRQVLQGLEYLHTKCKIIHTDIKPENILLRVDEVYVHKMAADTKLWQLPDSTVLSVNSSGKQKKRLSNLMGRLTGVFQTIGNWSSKASRSHLKRLMRKEKKQQQGQESDHQNETQCASVLSDVTTPSSTRSAACQSLLPCSDLKLRRRTLLLSDAPDSPELPHRNLTSSLPDITKDAPRSGFLHQTAEKVSAAHGSSNYDVALDLLLPHNADKLLIKIADLGNACWVHKHFTEDIQTCQYRSVEVLIGADYGTPADIWSTACMAFELATGDYLFDPQPGATFSREEDHIAHIIELLGALPSQFVLSGKKSKIFFNQKGQLRHISKLKPWSLLEILLDKYEWPKDEAAQFSSFLVTMLQLQPEKRATAAQCLKHPWITS